ncbi:hypothetical protein HYW75_06010 [Candidatus Pacearchaeota archaeon]|nr:hypothetical protein [Candidatus Pacearchaeota archaeon]
MAEIYGTILASPFAQTVLLFVLVFVVVFAILQKSKVLGDGKKQIDALVALAIGLLFVGVGYATDLISKLIPFLAVSLIIIFVFLLIWGIFYVGGDGFKTPNGVRIAGGILALLAVVIAVVYFTGFWDTLLAFIFNNSGLVGNIVFIVIIGLAVWAAIGSKGDSGDSGSGKKRE